MSKERVLILCTANAARSQMAEGLLRDLAGARFDVFSAGAKPASVHPLAIEALHEVGIDISGHRSKNLSEFVEQPFDYVITVCDNAAESCPFFPGPAQRIHWGMPDPAAVTGDHAAQLASFRSVRDALKTQFEQWLNT